MSPTPTDVRNVLDGLADGTGVYFEWMLQGALPDKDFERELFWVTPCENNLQHEICACGHTAGEAAAAAYIDSVLDGSWWLNGVRPLTAEEIDRVPLSVPAGWEFDINAMPASVSA